MLIRIMRRGVLTLACVLLLATAASAADEAFTWTKTGKSGQVYVWTYGSC